MTTIGPASRKPAWRLLPCIVAVMGALLAVIERIALPPALRTILQIAITAGGFSMIGFWIRCNRIAMAMKPLAACRGYIVPK